MCEVNIILFLTPTVREVLKFQCDVDVDGRKIFLGCTSSPWNSEVPPSPCVGSCQYELEDYFICWAHSVGPFGRQALKRT